MISRTVGELENAGYTVDDVIYVDDRTIHIDGVKMAFPGVDFVHMWVDVKSFEELMQLLEKLG